MPRKYTKSPPKLPIERLEEKREYIRERQTFLAAVLHSSIKKLKSAPSNNFDYIAFIFNKNDVPALPGRSCWNSEDIGLLFTTIFSPR